jgi:hypothetical protein
MIAILLAVIALILLAMLLRGVAKDREETLRKHEVERAELDRMARAYAYENERGEREAQLAAESAERDRVMRAEWVAIDARKAAEKAAQRGTQ